MKLRWTFRCYPTVEQAQALSQTFGCTRYVYNYFLAKRTEAFKGGNRMNYAQSDRELTILKRDSDHLWLNDVSCVPTQQSLRDLQTAFNNFFEKRAKYPSFKQKGDNESARYTHSAFKFEVGNQRLIIAKLGYLKVKWSRHMYLVPSTVTIIRKPSGKYFATMVVDIDPVQLPKTEMAVGIDFGISRLATLSTGEKVANPKYTYKYARQLKREQQSLARKQPGSNRRSRQKQRVARVHEKITNSRQDVAKKFAWDLVSRFDTIYVEDLNLRGMVKNHNLARSLSDAGIGEAIRTIESKAAMHGKTVVKVDRWFPSSKMCSECGQLQPSMPLSIRTWTCPCGATHDRDENAAKNILAVGQTVSGRGDDVRAS